VYVDDQQQNLADFRELLSQLAAVLGASKTMIRYRLIDLQLLHDARTAYRESALQTAVALKTLILSGLNHQFQSRR
jgi:hypothetical protein